MEMQCSMRLSQLESPDAASVHTYWVSALKLCLLTLKSGADVAFYTHQFAASDHAQQNAALHPLKERTSLTITTMPYLLALVLACRAVRAESLAGQHQVSH